MVSKKDFKRDFFKKAFSESRFNPKGDRVATELNSFFDNINDDDSMFLSKRGSDNNLDQHSHMSPPTPRSLTPKLQKNKSYSSFLNENINNQTSSGAHSGSKRLSVLSKASSNLSRMPSSYSAKNPSESHEHKIMPDSNYKYYNNKNSDLYSDTRSIKSSSNRSMHEMRSYNNNPSDFSLFQQQHQQLLPSYSPYNSPLLLSPKLYSSPSYHSMQQPHALNHDNSQAIMAPLPMSPQLMSPSSAFSSSPSSPPLGNPQFMPLSPSNLSPLNHASYQQSPFSPLLHHQPQPFSPLLQHSQSLVQPLSVQPPKSSSSSSTTTTATKPSNSSKPQRASIVLTTRQIDLVTSSWAQGFDKINLKVQSNQQQQLNEDSSMTVESLSFLLNDNLFWFKVFERVQYSEHPEILKSLPSHEIVKMTYSTVIGMFISCLKHQPIQFSEIKQYLSKRGRLHESKDASGTKKSNSEVRLFYNTLVDAISYCLKDHYRQFYTSELRSSWLALLSYVSVGIMGKCPIDLIIRKFTYTSKNQGPRQQQDNKPFPHSLPPQENNNLPIAGQATLSKQQLKQLEQLQLPTETSSTSTSATTNTMSTTNTTGTAATGNSEVADSYNGNVAKQYLTHKFSISNLATYKLPAGMTLHTNNNMKFQDIGRAESVKSDSPLTVENPFYKRNPVSITQTMDNTTIGSSTVKDGI